MSKPFLIGFDVDSNIADSLTAWLTWANKKVENNKLVEPLNISAILTRNANLDWGYHGTLMQEQLGIDNPWEFWSIPDLYDNVKPFSGSVQWITQFRQYVHEMNLDVKFVIVTTCFPEHEKNKRDWTKDQYPGLFDGFVSTGDKHLVGLDMIFDDKMEHCENVVNNGAALAICQEVGLDRTTNNPGIITPDTEYGGLWNYLLNNDPNGQQLLNKIGLITKS